MPISNTAFDVHGHPLRIRSRIPCCGLKAGGTNPYPCWNGTPLDVMKRVITLSRDPISELRDCHSTLPILFSAAAPTFVVPEKDRFARRRSNGPRR